MNNTKVFSETNLENLRKLLIKVKVYNTENKDFNNYVNLLLKSIQTYRDSGSIAIDEIGDNLKQVIPHFNQIPINLCQEIICLTCESCRACMFHTDQCFINITYLIFKSVANKEIILQNKVRPPMRETFLRSHDKNIS